MFVFKDCLGTQYCTRDFQVEEQQKANEEGKYKMRRAKKKGIDNSKDMMLYDQPGCIS